MRVLQDVEVGELLDRFDARQSFMESAAAPVETCSYGMARQSFDIVVSTCWTRRVVHPPLYSRAFRPAQDRMVSFENTEDEAYDKGLFEGDCESDLSNAMQKLRVKQVQHNDAAKVRPYTSARSLRDTPRPFLPVVYVQIRTDSFRFFEVLDKLTSSSTKVILKRRERYGCSSILSLHFRPLNTIAARTHRCCRNAWFASSSTSWLPG